MADPFDCTMTDVAAGFDSRFTLLVLAFRWSPSSMQLVKTVREADLTDFNVDVRCLDADEALDFATKNGILAGAGGIKIYDGGRDVCFRRAAGLTYSIVSALRASQIRDILQRVVEATKVDSIAQIDL